MASMRTLAGDIPVVSTPGIFTGTSTSAAGFGFSAFSGGGAGGGGKGAFEDVPFSGSYSSAPSLTRIHKREQNLIYEKLRMNF